MQQSISKQIVCQIIYVYINGLKQKNRSSIADAL